VVAAALAGGCRSTQDTVQQQQEKLQSLAASTRLVAQSWLDGHVSKTYANTAFEALLTQVEQQRAVLAAKPATLADGHAATLSQQAEQLSRLIAQLHHDVSGGDAWTLRGRLGSIPMMPETK
jgi:hypothetical protein